MCHRVDIPILNSLQKAAEATLKPLRARCSCLVPDPTPPLWVLEETALQQSHMGLLEKQG